MKNNYTTWTLVITRQISVKVPPRNYTVCQVHPYSGAKHLSSWCENQLMWNDLPRYLKPCESLTKNTRHIGGRGKNITSYVLWMRTVAIEMTFKKMSSNCELVYPCQQSNLAWKWRTNIQANHPCIEQARLNQVRGWERKWKWNYSEFATVCAPRSGPQQCFKYKRTW